MLYLSITALIHEAQQTVFYLSPTHHKAFGSSVSSTVPPHVCHAAMWPMLLTPLQKAGSSPLLPTLSPLHRLLTSPQAPAREVPHHRFTAETQKKHFFFVPPSYLPLISFFFFFNLTCTSQLSGT